MEMQHRESLADLHGRIAEFAPGSLYFSDSLCTRGNEKLTCKVNEDGTLKPFPGNTTVFMFDEQENKWIENLQSRLYADQDLANALFADRLGEETFHMTLHDLANPSTWKDGHTIENTREAALKVLAEIKKDFKEPIRMRPTWMFSMLNISILLGLEPVDDENCSRLLEMFERFHEVVPLSWPKLTPHITLAYYRPMEASWEQLEKLRAILNGHNEYYENNKDHEDYPVFLLRPENLFYQEFADMNNYRTVIGDMV